jgi:hypothetical protein
MLSTMLTHLQEQAVKLSHVEQNQQAAPQTPNNHAQNSLHNVLQGEISSQQYRTGQRIPRTGTIVNTNGNNVRFNKETSIVEVQDAENTYGNENCNNGNNENGGRGENSSGADFSNSESTRYEPYEERRRGEDNRHPGRTPFTLRILRSEISRALEKSPKLETYNGTTDLDGHLDHLDTVLDYYQARGATKCRLFVLTLKGAAMTWFKGLEDNSIDSWGELRREFSSHFIARKRQPKMVASLSNIIQGKEETLKDYIESLGTCKTCYLALKITSTTKKKC